MKRKNEIKKRIETTISERMALKQSSLEAYSNAINKFCKAQKINPFDFPKIGLESIEEQTERFIISNVDTLSPKYLNIIYNAVKTWCFTLKMIKNRRLFREIKFDKTSRAVDAMTEKPLETQHMKQLMEITDAYEKVLIGLYGLCGIRPSIIRQLKVKDVDANDYQLENGKIKFTAKNPFLCVPSRYEGNKAHKMFFVIVPSKVKDLIEYCLNQNGNVTKNTLLLSKYGKSPQNMFLKTKKLLKQVGFEGRPYSLRSFGSRLLARTLEGKNAIELKEFMMGHKGTISTIYEKRALTQEDKTEYLEKYAATEKWINEQVFGTRSQEELSEADRIKRYSIRIGVAEDKAMLLYAEFKKGKFSMDAYESKFADLTKQALEDKMKSQFEKLFLEMNRKHNNTK